MRPLTTWFWFRDRSMLTPMSGISPIRSSYASAMSGLNQASRRFEGSAARVANLDFGTERVTISDQARAGADSSTNLVDETVTQITSALSFRANLKTLATAQSLDETLLALGAIPDKQS